VPYDQHVEAVNVLARKINAKSTASFARISDSAEPGGFWWRPRHGDLARHRKAVRDGKRLLRG